MAAQIRHSLRLGKEGINRLREVPKWIRQTVVIWVAAEAVLYSSLFVNVLFPTWSNTEVSMFIGEHYTLYGTWWVKFLSDHVSRVLYGYVAARIALRVSDYLFLVASIFLVFRIFDFLLYFWNFCHDGLVYIDLFWTALTLILTVFKGYKPETIAKIKSLF